MRAGFTRIEVLILIAIVAIVGVLSVTAIQKARDEGARTQTENNLKQFASVPLKFHDIHKRFPPAWGPFPPSSQGKQASGPAGTFHYWLLPFFEADHVYK